MNAEEQVADLLTPTLEAMGYDLVRLRLIGSQNITMQVMAERRDGVNMTVEDCELISREVSTVLDVEDPITDSYSLEISSPGIDRPLIKRSDYERYSGFEVKIEMRTGVDGRKRFRGKLLGLDDDLVKICLNERTFDLPVGDIQRAKLVLTENLPSRKCVKLFIQGRWQNKLLIG